MSKETRDKGLRKAMQEADSYKLSSNFTFRAMQKVEELARRQEQRQEWWGIVAATLASVCLLAGFGIVFVYYGGVERTAVWTDAFTFTNPLEGFSMPPMWWSFPLLLLFFLTLDYWMRRWYDKYHS